VVLRDVALRSDAESPSRLGPRGLAYLAARVCTTLSARIATPHIGIRGPSHRVAQQYSLLGPRASFGDFLVASVSTLALSLFVEAVAQTSTELTNAVLRVGSKIVRLVARTRRDRADVGDLSVRYGHHSAHSAGFRGRLYATASVPSGSAVPRLPSCVGGPDLAAKRELDGCRVDRGLSDPARSSVRASNDSLIR
jgi:hypothetical protein